jgi:hypothetical protein
MAGLKGPTTRKVLRRGWIPCRYRLAGDHECVKHGWIVSEDPERKAVVIQLVGEDRRRKITGDERRFLTRLA